MTAITAGLGDHIHMVVIDEALMTTPGHDTNYGGDLHTTIKLDNSLYGWIMQKKVDIFWTGDILTGL